MERVTCPFHWCDAGWAIHQGMELNWNESIGFSRSCNQRWVAVPRTPNYWLAWATQSMSVDENASSSIWSSGKASTKDKIERQYQGQWQVWSEIPLFTHEKTKILILLIQWSYDDSLFSLFPSKTKSAADRALTNPSNKHNLFIMGVLHSNMMFDPRSKYSCLSVLTGRIKQYWTSKSYSRLKPLPLFSQH